MRFSPTALTLTLSLLAAGAAAAQSPGTSGKGAVFKDYPPESLARREEGTVGYRVEISRRGELESCEVTRSSGFERLDRATCATVIRYARVKARTGPDGKPVRTVFDGTMVWKVS